VVQRAAAAAGHDPAGDRCDAAGAARRGLGDPV